MVRMWKVQRHSIYIFIDLKTKYNMYCYEHQKVQINAVLYINISLVIKQRNKVGL